MPNGPEQTKIDANVENLNLNVEREKTIPGIIEEIEKLDSEDVLNDEELKSLLVEAANAIEDNVTDLAVAKKLMASFKEKLEPIQRALHDLNENPKDGLKKIEKDIHAIVDPILNDTVSARLGALSSPTEMLTTKEISPNIHEISLNGERYVCSLNEYSRIIVVEFRGSKISFQPSLPIRNFLMLAENLKQAWRQMELQKTFIPNSNQQFRSPDGFRFKAKNFCVTPFDVLVFYKKDSNSGDLLYKTLGGTLVFEDNKGSSSFQRVLLSSDSMHTYILKDTTVVYEETNNARTEQKTFVDGKLREEAVLNGSKKIIGIRYNRMGKKELIIDYSKYTATVVDAKGAAACRYEYGAADGDLEMPVRITMLSESGDFADYRTERTKNAELTPDQYLEMLAKKLNTTEKLRVFFEAFMQYVYDSADPKNPLDKGMKFKRGEYWQLAEETVQRVEQGRMLGDCDDYAFLAQKILILQGKHALVIEVPGHAECFWVEKNGNQYKGYSLGTYGLDEQQSSSLEGVVNALYKKWHKTRTGESNCLIF